MSEPNVYCAACAQPLIAVTLHIAVRNGLPAGLYVSKHVCGAPSRTGERGGVYCTSCNDRGCGSCR